MDSIERCYVALTAVKDFASSRAKSYRRRNPQNSQGSRAIDNIMSLKESSMDAIGRAVYLSQDGSDAAQAFAKGGEHSILYPGFA